MLQLNLTQITTKTSPRYGKYYAYVDKKEMLDLKKLARHMSEHNSPYSEGMIYGVLRDMVKCIREQTLLGNSVKIDDLAIFKVNVVNRKGWSYLKDVSLQVGGSANIQAVKLVAQATGEFKRSELTGDSSLTLTKEWGAKVADAKKAEQNTGE